ncbi:MAG: CYCXC family (seleno)protein [Acidobacteriota bacterium]
MKRAFLLFSDRDCVPNHSLVSLTRHLLLIALALFAVSCGQAGSSEPQATPAASPGEHGGHDAQASMTPRVPQFRPRPTDPRALPVTLDPSTFTSPYIAHSYRVAKEIPEVLAQQPCYCYCDAGFGHKSLLDCHVDDHSAGCDVCVKESLLVEQLHHQGKSAEDIREAIVRGEWRNVELK